MRKVLQFAGLISLVLGVVAFILMMATPAVIQPLVGDTQTVYAGTTAIFGKTESTILGDVVTKPSALALIGWILLLIGMIIVALGVILPLFKVKALTKFAGLLNLIVVIALVVAGIFMFIQVPTFLGAAGRSDASGYALGAGWIISAIVAIVAGVCAILPAAVDLASKK